MILPFSTELNGMPTYFLPKIWRSIKQKYDVKDYILKSPGYVFAPNGIQQTLKPKKHTIRQDKNDRWKPGVMIDFFINSRTKDMFRFAPRIPVVSTQDIEIVWSGGEINTVGVWIDNKCYVANYEKDYNQSKQRQERMEVLAFNDGFDSVEDFLNYFNQDFTGKLIHWTDFKY